MTTRPAGAPPIEMSKKTCGRSLASVLPLAHRTVAGQLEGHSLEGTGSRTLFVTLGSAAATAAIAAERNARRGIVMCKRCIERACCQKKSLEFDSSVSQHASPFLRDGHKKGL